MRALWRTNSVRGIVVRPTLDAARWRTATIIACAVAASSWRCWSGSASPSSAGRSPTACTTLRSRRSRACRRFRRRRRPERPSSRADRRTCSSSTAAAPPVPQGRRRTGCAPGLPDHGRGQREEAVDLDSHGRHVPARLSRRGGASRARRAHADRLPARRHAPQRPDGRPGSPRRRPLVQTGHAGGLELISK